MSAKEFHLASLHSYTNDGANLSVIFFSCMIKFLWLFHFHSIEIHKFMTFFSNCFSVNRAMHLLTVQKLIYLMLFIFDFQDMLNVSIFKILNYISLMHLFVIFICLKMFKPFAFKILCIYEFNQKLALY